MKKRVLSVVMVLCFCLSLLPTSALAGDIDSGAVGEITVTEAHTNHCVCGATHGAVGDHKDESVISSWKGVAALSEITESGNYYLTADVTQSTGWTIESGVNVVLCLNGHTVTVSNTEMWDYIPIYGTLTLTDCKGNGAFVGVSNGYGKVFRMIGTESVFNMYGGTIKGMHTKGGYLGGGLRNTGTFNMYGGSIEENVSAGAGGGIYSEPGATVNMYGGVIKNNSAKSGGGKDIYIDANSTSTGSINANGGTVEGDVVNKGVIAKADGYGGTSFNGAVTNEGTIESGTFGGTVKNTGTIKGGSFDSAVTNKGTIKGGSFDGTVTNSGTIENGTFDDAVTNTGTVKGGTFNDTLTNNGTVEFADNDAYEAAKDSITGMGIIKVGSGDTAKTYLCDGTEMNGFYDDPKWSDITANKFKGINWNSTTNTLTLNNVSIDELNLGIGYTDDITIIVDKFAKITALVAPYSYSDEEYYKGNVTICGKTGRTTDKLVSGGEIYVVEGGLTLKDLTADLWCVDSYFIPEKPIQLNNCDVTLNYLEINYCNAASDDDWEGDVYGIELTDSTLTIDGTDNSSGNIIVVEKITMDDKSTIEMKNACFGNYGIIDDGFDGLINFLPVGFSISDKGELYPGYTIMNDLTDDVAYNLVLKRYYKVEFDLGGGKVNEKDTLDFQRIARKLKVTAPNDPEFDDKIFLGWYEKSEDGKFKATAFDFENTELEDDITLYARFADPTYSVSYNPGVDGTGDVQTDTKDYGTDTTLLGDVFTRKGYKQIGWATEDGGEKVYELGETYDEYADLTLYPVWKKKSSGATTETTYTVKFDTNGGNAIASQNVAKNGKASEPAEPTKDGFVFDGWYTSGKFTTKYDFNATVTKNITLYAKWWGDDVQEPIDDNNEEQKPNGGNNENPPAEDENKAPFGDVNEGDWFYDSVMYAYENGLMNGISEKTFAPNDNVTRAMFVTVLYRAEGEPAVNRSIPFADVKADAYYANAVIWAQQNGIVTGITENEFAPDENITREQIATILYRYAKYKGIDVGEGGMKIREFEDYDNISEYALNAITWTVNAGLLNGKSETTLAPEDNATRAEFATILQRFTSSNE